MVETRIHLFVQLLFTVGRTQCPAGSTDALPVWVPGAVPLLTVAPVPPDGPWHPFPMSDCKHFLSRLTRVPRIHVHPEP